MFCRVYTKKTVVSNADKHMYCVQKIVGAGLTMYMQFSGGLNAC